MLASEQAIETCLLFNYSNTPLTSLTFNAFNAFNVFNEHYMKKYFIANWKMNLGFGQTLSLAANARSLPQKKFELILAPSFPMIRAVKKQCSLDLAAQNCAAWAKGAYTGEVSAKTLKELNCKYVIIGHSERREHLNENNEMINQKVKQAWKTQLIPILCFGEKEQEMENREQVIVNQIKSALANAKPNENNRIMLAYEPVWAIGTGKNCSANIVKNVSRIVKRIIVSLQSSDFWDEKASFLYGGSVDSKNIKEYLKVKEIKGFLVGSTSLDPDELKKIF